MSTNRKPLQKYNPGSLDESDTESLKMSVNEELWEISTNFMQTDEILGDAFEKINTLEIDRDDMNAKIEETYRLSVEGDKVLAEKIDEVSGWIETEGGKLEGLVKDEATVRIEQDEALAQKITTLKAELETEDTKLGSQITDTNKVVTDLKGTVATNKLELESSINDAKKELSDKDEEVIAQAEKDLADARKALAEAITSGDADAAKKLQAEVDKLIGIINANKTEVESKLSVINTTIANGDKALSEQITSATASFNGQISSVNQTISAQANKLGQVESKWGVSMTANGKVSGVSMNNNGSSSTFSVVADKFSISDGSNTTNPPFQVVGGHTRIMSAFVNTLQSDNWDGANNGWAITNNGWAHFNNVTVRGTVYANAGTFNNITVNENCTVKGKIFATNLDEGTAAVRVATAINQTLSFPGYARARTVVIWGMRVKGRAASGTPHGTTVTLQIVANGSVLYSENAKVGPFDLFQIDSLTSALQLPAGQAASVVAQLHFSQGGSYDQLTVTPLVAGAYIQ